MLIRNIMIKSIVFILIFLMSINTVYGESGNIQAAKYFSKLGYTDVSGGANSGSNFTLLNFNIASYNSIQDFYITSLLSTSYKHVSNESYFTCQYPNICNGYVSYNQNGKIINWDFQDGNIISQSPIKLIYEKNIFDSNNFVYPLSERCNSLESLPTDNKPIFILCNNGYNLYSLDTALTDGIIYNSNISSITTVGYNITYPTPLHYLAHITKGAYDSINNKVYFNTKTVTQFSELLFNHTSFDTYLPYLDELYIEVITSAGADSGNILINNSNLLVGYNLTFNKSQYSLGENINFSYSIYVPSGSGYYFFETTQTDISDNMYKNTYDIGWSLSDTSKSGYLVPSIFTDMISDFKVCIIQGNTEVFCKTISYGSISDASIVPTGNLTLNKNSYNASEIVELRYNISTNGRIIIERKEAGSSFTETIFNQQAFSGNNKIMYYTNNYVDTAYYFVYLQYLRNGTYLTLDTKKYQTKSNLNIVNFLTETIEQGNNLEIEYSINQSGFLILKDSSNNIKFNYSVTNSNGNAVRQSYKILFNDLIGIWNIYLYDSTMNQLSTDSITVNTGISINPTPIQTTSTASLMDVSNEVGKAVFGDIERDNNGHITSDGISKFGDNIFYFLALMCTIAILIMVFGKRK